MRYFLDRLREPSTFAGLAGLLAGIGLLGLSEAQWNEIFGVIAGFAGIVAMFIGERNGSKQ